MWKMTLTIFFFGCAFANHASYKGYVVFETIPRNHSHVELLANFEDDSHYDFWSSIRALNYPVTIMVNPDHVAKFVILLKTHTVQFHAVIRDIDGSIRRERNRMRAAHKVRKGGMSFNTYHDYTEILNYLKQLSSDYANIVKLEIYGHSCEGRELIAVKIGNGAWTNPTIFIDSSFHGREWISTAVSLYTIRQLVQNKRNNALIRNANWVIIPVVNPDGYEYSHKVDRLWRKTRNTYKGCAGVDAYRNFDYQWSNPNTEDECSVYFPGPEPFSEVETKAFRDFALGTENIALYITLHSFGKWITYPWGFTVKSPINLKELQNLGEKVAKAIAAVNGTEYSVGVPPDIAKPISGTSRDWMKSVVGVKLSYALELPGGDCSGFDPPLEKILPVCTETWAGIKEFYNSIIQDILLVER